MLCGAAVGAVTSACARELFQPAWAPASAPVAQHACGDACGVAAGAQRGHSTRDGALHPSGRVWQGLDVCAPERAGRGAPCRAGAPQPGRPAGALPCCQAVPPVRHLQAACIRLAAGIAAATALSCILAAPAASVTAACACLPISFLFACSHAGRSPCIGGNCSEASSCCTRDKHTLQVVVTGRDLASAGARGRCRAC